MNDLNYIISILPENIASILSNLDSNILDRITELRIRRDKPIVVVFRNTSYFIDCNSDIYDYVPNTAFICDNDTFDKIFMQICDYSLYSNMESLKAGYITLKNGSRVGVSSTAVADENGMISVKDIASLNIRVPRYVKNSASEILNCLYVNSTPSIIIAGRVNSGKTTVLRDLAYQLSNGFNHRYRKVAIIDERNEICAKNNIDFALNVGINTDVLTGFTKSKGIEIATRTLSPEIIVCDEISTIEEVDSILYAFASGVSFALSVHIGNKDDIYRKPVIRKLIDSGEFSYIVLLDEYTYKPEIIEGNDIFGKNSWDDNIDSIINLDGFRVF